jgi:predicted DCC family thiol-disulfide oxidoreductase YuxK
MSVVKERPELHVDQHPIVFFDGVCGLCNRSVQRFLKMDRPQRLKFAPLQGETAQQLLTQRLLERADIEELKSLVLFDSQGTARRSTAIVRILCHVGGFWAFIGSCLWLIPLPIRDWGYRFVSNHRYQWFGKAEACRLPQPEERDRFLP